LIRILLIGPLPYPNRKNTIGGATVLFKEMIRFLEEDNKQLHTVISSNRFRGRCLSLLYLLTKTFISLKKNEIILLNVNSAGVRFLWPLFNLISRLSGKKLVLRVFGSHFEDDLELKYFSKTLKRLLPKLDLLLLETNYLVEKFQPLNPKVKWMPNVRQASILDQDKDKQTWVRKYKKKFIFLGHINSCKGIIELLKAFSELPMEYKLSIYGDIQDNSLLFLKKDPNYKGVINPNDIFSALHNNDVLILPTYYQGEGYPGVIIEAYREGLPVISTNWKSIPEIVEDGKTGILVSPKDVLALKNAILFFNENNYVDFSNNAKVAFNKFDSNAVHDELFNQAIPNLFKKL